LAAALTVPAFAENVIAGNDARTPSVKARRGLFQCTLNKGKDTFLQQFSSARQSLPRRFLGQIQNFRNAFNGMVFPIK